MSFQHESSITVDPLPAIVPRTLHTRSSNSKRYARPQRCTPRWTNKSRCTTPCLSFSFFYQSKNKHMLMREPSSNVETPPLPPPFFLSPGRLKVTNLMPAGQVPPTQFLPYPPPSNYVPGPGCPPASSGTQPSESNPPPGVYGGYNPNSGREGTSGASGASASTSSGGLLRMDKGFSLGFWSFWAVVWVGWIGGWRSWRW